MNNFKPRIVIFRCDYCAPPGAESMLASKLKDNFQGCVVAYDKYGFVAEVLELAHLSQNDGVAEVYISASRVQAELYAELPGGFGRLGEFVL